jgi:hypothetical protein
MASADVASAEWVAQRNAAQVILSAYEKSVVESLPDMMLFLLKKMGGRVSLGEFIFGLAQHVDMQVSGQTDPITGDSLVFPMGRDVVIAAIAQEAMQRHDIADEVDLCTKTEMVLEHISRNKMLKRRLANSTSEPPAVYDAIQTEPDADFHPNVFRQIAMPMVFGGKYALSARDVQAVNENFPAHEDRCMKLVNAFSVAQGGGGKPVALTLIPRVSMDADVFYERLVTVTTETPGLLLRALSGLGYMGPAFFRREMVLPAGVTYPFGTQSLPLAFAEDFSREVEQPPAKVARRQ